MSQRRASRALNSSDAADHSPLAREAHTVVYLGYRSVSAIRDDAAALILADGEEL
jgi:hypothetical protein